MRLKLTIISMLLTLAVVLGAACTPEQAEAFKKAWCKNNPTHPSCVVATTTTTVKPTTTTTVPTNSNWTLLPVGSSLPSESYCASAVARKGWEFQPSNATANNTILNVSLPTHPDYDSFWQNNYKSRITGNYKGTTDEIIQWAACKWGLDAEVMRAQAFNESGWRMSAEGDWERRSNGHCTFDDNRDPCPTSFGILQNKWYYNPGSYPAIKQSTAWHLDFSGAKLRGCYDGHKFINNIMPVGDIWGCYGNWFSGDWKDSGANAYVEHLKDTLASKPWL